jgi:hypothetical protein
LFHAEILDLHVIVMQENITYTKIFRLKKIKKDDGMMEGNRFQARDRKWARGEGKSLVNSLSYLL